MTRTPTTFAALLGLTAILSAAPPPVAAVDLQVNTYTNSNQRYPAVARAGDGSFVVVWESFQAGTFYDVFGQRFDSAGGTVGGEFQINTHTTATQARAAIAMKSDGAFVVVWESYNQEGAGSNYGIFARRYDSSGAPQGNELLVNENTAFAQRFPAVAIDEQGDFVVAWENPGGYGGSTEIVARRFDSSGTPAEGAFQVNQYTLYTQRRPAASSDGDGAFVITWDSRHQDAVGDYGVFGRRYDSAGAAQGGELQINAYTSLGQSLSSVAHAGDGSFVVVWHSFQDGPTSLGVFGQRFDSTGARAGAEFMVNTRTVNDQRFPAVDVRANGDFLVTWTDGAGDGSGDAIFARTFEAGGAPAAGDFQVNSYTVDDQRYPTVAFGDDGGYVVAWTSAQQDGLGLGVFARLVPPLPLFDVDGNGAISALTDGLLNLRFGFGLTDSALVSGAVSGNCTRCTADAIEAYLASLGGERDVDGNGVVQALTDGLLLVRYAFGLRDTALTGGAVGGMCSRCTAAQIEPYLAERVLPPDPV
jgi:hypothetical protein